MVTSNATVLLAAVLAIIATDAMARVQLPNNTDLKAAYCLPVESNLSGMVGELSSRDDTAHSASDAKIIADAQALFRDKVRRLQLYLAPRLQDLESSGIAVAARRAHEDLAQAGADAIACANESGRLTDNESCLVRSEAVKRLRSCDDLSFLPF